MNIMNTRQFSNSPFKQQGLTLIEIMVAVTLSLVLLAGVLQIFTSTKASYNLQSGIGRLHENARFALDIMSQNISMAGFADLSMTGTTIDAFNTANTQDNVTPNVTLGFTVADETASDTIDVNYQAIANCTGTQVNGGAFGVATDRYYLNGTDLMCIGNGNAAGAVIIAQGVENMQILYGVDDDADGISNRYVSASNVTSFDDVVSVRIAILIDSVENVSGSQDTNTYNLLNSPALGPFNDNVYRRIFTRTVLLRNQSVL